MKTFVKAGRSGLLNRGKPARPAALTRLHLDSQYHIAQGESRHRGDVAEHPGNGQAGMIQSACRIQREIPISHL